MDNIMLIGEVLKAQGIRGEIKIKLYSSDKERSLQIKNVIIGDVDYRILNIRENGGYYFISLKGVADRDEAELFRGKEIKARRDEMPPLNSGEFFVVDVIGSQLIDENDNVLGTVEDILTGSRDIYTIKDNVNKIMRFPLLKDLLIEINVPKKYVKVNLARLREVSVYED